MEAKSGGATTQGVTFLRRLQARYLGEEDASGLVFFRIMWGVAMAVEACRYLFSGWVTRYFVAPDFLFKYPCFEWVSPLPGSGMHVLYVGMGVAGLCVALGVGYRWAALFGFVAHTYAFLCAASRYLNHGYLIGLVSLLVLCMPLDRAGSLRAMRNPQWGRQTLPSWPRLLLIAQVLVVYFYGAVAKVNRDWLEYHQPIGQWLLHSASGLPDPFAGWVVSRPFLHVVAYGGVLFDLCVGPALLWRRTRWLALLASAFFHLSNSVLFSIGIFPWLMLGITTVFLPPQWPRCLPCGLGALWSRWLARCARSADSSLEAGSSVSSSQSGVSAGASAETFPMGRPYRRWVWVGSVMWIGLQVLLPLRHHLYPGPVVWNEAGHRGAWRMKLRSKGGRVTYRVQDLGSTRRWSVNPADELTRKQVAKIQGQPDFILQYARHLAAGYRHKVEGGQVAVFADAWVALNGRPAQRFVDPSVDLLQVKLGPLHGVDWLQPFTWEPPPLPPQLRGRGAER